MCCSAVQELGGIAHIEIPIEQKIFAEISRQLNASKETNNKSSTVVRSIWNKTGDNKPAAQIWSMINSDNSQTSRCVSPS